jgi:hypothetical protein
MAALADEDLKAQLLGAIQRQCGLPRPVGYAANGGFGLSTGSDRSGGTLSS